MFYALFLLDAESFAEIICAPKSVWRDYVCLKPDILIIKTFLLE